MLCETSMELIRETSRNVAGGNLGPFDEDKVRSVLDEVNALYAQNEAELSQSHVMNPAIHIRHAAIERNKRCLAAYVAHRVDR